MGRQRLTASVSQSDWEVGRVNRGSTTRETSLFHPVTVESKNFWFSSPRGTRKQHPPTSGTVPDSTNNLCHPSRAFKPSFNHLQPTRLLSTVDHPEPGSTTKARV
ncbi:hypothetical protein CROQUDRAFT_88140 [Cronartium quercuum f. sp. fusiforme G11]|uniref:Uncharacterized protein n=1 Tax=Cronartium quercuum f. sp. fusiforme G11 TaxID=708437 RepID=A0A9P6NND7_9BASI|nr:hypothetical protein CROQUDRAFT_88140 [Cronartium quercuum f. sp. fusiforme G11]